MPEALRCLECRVISILKSKDRDFARRAAAMGARLYCPRCNDVTYRKWFIAEPYRQPSLDDIARGEGTRWLSSTRT